MPLRILHVDDDPGGRQIVGLSLGVDPTFAVLSCSCEDDALGIMDKWTPDLILCDATMPGTDGPTMLAHWRDHPKTAHIPVVFILARDQPAMVDRLKSLGAAGMILKPFDPATLSGLVRSHLCLAKLDTMRDSFSQRLQADATVLSRFQAASGSDPMSSDMLGELQSCAHKLAGAAGVFGLPAVSCAASKLEESVIDRRRGGGAPENLEADLDALLACIESSGRHASAATAAPDRLGSTGNLSAKSNWGCS